MSVSRWRIRLTHETAEGTAAGIYGIIVSSAVLVTAHAETAYKLDIIVVVTLIIYWLAERYARIIAERIHEGHRPRWHAVRWLNDGQAPKRSWWTRRRSKEFSAKPSDFALI